MVTWLSHLATKIQNRAVLHGVMTAYDKQNEDWMSIQNSWNYTPASLLQEDQSDFDNTMF